MYLFGHQRIPMLCIVPSHLLSLHSFFCSESLYCAQKAVLRSHKGFLFKMSVKYPHLFHIHGSPLEN